MNCLVPEIVAHSAVWTMHETLLLQPDVYVIKIHENLQHYTSWVFFSSRNACVNSSYANEQE